MFSSASAGENVYILFYLSMLLLLGYFNIFLEAMTIKNMQIYEFKP